MYYQLLAALHIYTSDMGEVSDYNPTDGVTNIYQRVEEAAPTEESIKWNFGYNSMLPDDNPHLKKTKNNIFFEIICFFPQFNPTEYEE